MIFLWYLDCYVASFHHLMSLKLTFPLSFFKKYLEVKDIGLKLPSCKDSFFVAGEYFCRTVHAGDSAKCLSHFLVMRPITIAVLHLTCVSLAPFFFVFQSFASLSLLYSHYTLIYNHTVQHSNLFILIYWTVSVSRLVLGS